jgi:Fic family protein
MVDKLSSIRNKRAIISNLKPANADLMDNISDWFKLELTYSNNALSGNNLSRMETIMVLEKAIAIGGKLLREHFEVLNHATAYDYIMSLIKKTNFDENNLLETHRLLLKNIDDEHAGKFRLIPQVIVGSATILPDPVKIPKLIADFVNNLNSENDTLSKALKVHYALVTIHPFLDGNGKVARLLMNLLLMQGGYPPAIIRPKDRLKYLKSLELAQTGGSLEPFTDILLDAIERSLNIFIKAVKGEAMPVIKTRESLIKIGELAEETGESLSTLRYWVKRGLLEVGDTAESGYQFFDKSEIEKCKLIRRLQNQRLTLEEVQKRLENDMVD